MGQYYTLYTPLILAASLTAAASFAFGPTASTRRPLTQQRAPPALFVFSSAAGGGSFSQVSTDAVSYEADDYFLAATDHLPTGEDKIPHHDLSTSILTATQTDHGLSLENPSLNFARFLIFLASAVYGTNFAVVKLIDEQMPFAVSAVLRFGLAAAVVSTMVLRGEAKETLTASVKQLEERVPATLAGMEIGGWYCLAYLSQAVGLQTADASKSAFFNALAVIVVPLLDSLLGGKQMGLKGITSVTLAILGVGLLQLGPAALAGTPMTFTQGDLFCLAQAAMFGVGYWRLEQVSGDYPSQAGRITAGQLVGVALGSTVFCGLTADIPTVQQLQGWMHDGFLMGGLAWTALVSTALALYLETIALKTVSAAELTVLMTSVSLFGSAFAYVTMGEVMSKIGMVGGLLILGGCLCVEKGEEGGENTEERLQAASTSLLSAALEEEGDSLVVEVQPGFSSPVPAFANATGFASIR